MGRSRAAGARAPQGAGCLWSRARESDEAADQGGLLQCMCHTLQPTAANLIRSPGFDTKLNAEACRCRTDPQPGPHQEAQNSRAARYAAHDRHTDHAGSQDPDGLHQGMLPVGNLWQGQPVLQILQLD